MIVNKIKISSNYTILSIKKNNIDYQLKKKELNNTRSKNK